MCDMFTYIIRQQTIKNQLNIGKYAIQCDDMGRLKSAKGAFCFTSSTDISVRNATNLCIDFVGPQIGKRKTSTSEMPFTEGGTG